MNPIDRAKSAYVPTLFFRLVKSSPLIADIFARYSPVATAILPIDTLNKFCVSIISIVDSIAPANALPTKYICPIVLATEKPL